MDIIDLGEKARAQYPGQFDDLSNWQLGKQLKESNPDMYKDIDDVPVGVTHKNVKATFRTALFKSIAGLGSALGVTASPTTKNILSPLVQQLPIGDAAKGRLRKLSDPANKNTEYASRILEEILPDIFKYKPVKTKSRAELTKTTGADVAAASNPSGDVSIPNLTADAESAVNMAQNVGKTALRIGTDTVLDPLTWVGLGIFTKLGRLLTMAHEASQAGEVIRLNSPLAKAIAVEMKVAKPSPAMIQRFLRQIPAKTFSGQVASGERSLLSLTNPIGEGSIPLLTGPKVAKVLAPLDVIGKSAAYSRIDKVVRGVFSTQSGNRDFDVLIGKAKSIAAHRAGLIIEDATVLNRNMRDISRETNIPREELNRTFYQIGEQLKQPTKVISQQKYGRAAWDALDAHYQDKLVDAKLELINAQKGLNPQPIPVPKPLEIGKYRPGILMEDGKFIIGSDHGDAYNRALDMGYDVDQTKLGQISGWKIDGKVYLDKDIPHGDPNQIIINLNNANQLKYTKAKAAQDALVSKASAESVDLAAKKVADYQGELNNLHGRYAPPTGINPKLEEQVRQTKAASANLLLEKEAAGLPAKPLMADIEHMAHVMTNDTRASMFAQAERDGTRIPSKQGKEMSTYLASSIRRQLVQVKPTVIEAWAQTGIISARDAKVIKGKNGIGRLDELLDTGRITEDQYTDAVHTLNIDDVQNLPIEMKRKIFGQGIKKDTQIFHTDPVYATAIRAVHDTRAIVAADFFNSMKQRGLAIPDELATKLHPDWVNVKTGELAGHRVDPQIARVLNKWNDFVTNPREFQDALNVYDRFHGLTKAWTLGIFPGYHSKNMVGNFWNNWLAGLNNPDRYREAHVIQEYARTGKGKVRFDNVLGGKWESPTILKKAQELGVIGQGQFGGDIQLTMKQVIEHGEFRWRDLVTPSQRNYWLRTGFKIGKRIEDNARLAHFIDRLRKGDTAEAAALSVKKFLFDYGDLTDIERNVLNRVFFFYTWTRKNLPLQLHALVTTPWKFGTLYKAKAEIERNVPDAPEKYLPEYIKENFGIRYRYDSKTKQYEYFMLNNWLPAADLLKVVHLHEIAAQSLAPIPKELIQQLWNYDFFFKKQIDMDANTENMSGFDKVFGKSKTRMFNRDIPTKLAHGMKAIRLLNEFDKLSKTDSDNLTKIVGLFLSKNQTFDPRQGRVQNAMRVQNDISELTSQLYREGNKKPMNKAEIQKIRAMIREKAKEF